MFLVVRVPPEATGQHLEDLGAKDSRFVRRTRWGGNAGGTLNPLHRLNAGRHDALITMNPVEERTSPHDEIEKLLVDVLLGEDRRVQHDRPLLLIEALTEESQQAGVVAFGHDSTLRRATPIQVASRQDVPREPLRRGVGAALVQEGWLSVV